MYPQQGQPIANTAIVNPADNKRHVSDAELLLESAQLWGYGLGLLVSGIICALTFWAVYYMGAVLAGLAIFAGTVQMSHSGGIADIRNNRCCFAPSGVFHNLYVTNIVNLVCGIIGALICVLGVVFHLTWLRYVAIAGLVGCIGVTIFGGLSFQRCNRLHNLIKQDIDINPTVIVTQQPVVMAQSQYPQAQSYPAAQPVQQGQAYPQQQPAYGQPQQQQPGYGQPQPAYGQPQPQPGYGQPPPPQQQQQQQGLYGNSNQGAYPPPPPPKTL